MIQMPFSSGEQPLNKAKSEDKPKEAEAEDSMYTDYQLQLKYGELKGNNIFDFLCLTIKDFLRFKPITSRLVKKNEVIDNIFFKVGVD